MSAFPPGMKGPAAKAKMNDLWQRVAGVRQLVDAAVISIDITKPERTYHASIAGSRTFRVIATDADGNPVALGDASLLELDGKVIELRVKHLAAGLVPVLDTANGFRFGSDISSSTFGTVINKTDYVCAQYNHADAVCDVLTPVTRGY